MKSTPVLLRIGLAGAAAALAGVVAPSAATAVPNVPHIASVRFTGTSGDYTVTVVGHHFGSPVAAVPFTGDASNFRIQDNDQLGAPGSGEWGYGTDVNTLTYERWTPNEVVVTGAGLAAGDGFFVALQNAASGRGASYGGNVPGGAGSNPVITAVGASSLGHLPSLRISVVGSGFGSPPRTLPFVGDVDQFYLSDPEVHCGGASALTAGGSYFGTRSADAVTLRFVQWTNTKIVIAGFGGAYGSGCNAVSGGDAFAVSVWSSSAVSATGPQTSHRGTLQYPGIAH